MKTADEVLEALPFINDRQEVVTKEYDGVVYKPTLYFNCDSGEWSCDFVSESHGCVLEFSGKSAMEAVQKASDYCIEAMNKHERIMSVEDLHKEQAREAAEIMLAYANGEEIEYKDRFDNDWKTGDISAFDFVHREYRIKKVQSPSEAREECLAEIMESYDEMLRILEINED